MGKPLLAFMATYAKYLVFFIVESFGKVTRLLMFNLTLSHCLLLCKPCTLALSFFTHFKTTGLISTAQVFMF